MHHNVPHAAPKDATTAKGSLARCSILYHLCALEALDYLNTMIYCATVIVINAIAACYETHGRKHL